VAQVGAVQRDDVGRAAQRERRPRGEAEVGVDDVVGGGAVTAADVAGRAHVAARGEGEHVDLDAVELAQGVDLVAHEAAPRGRGRRGPHVGDDQGTHPRVILHSCRLSPSHARAHTPRRSQIE
jgi:hypothetical protein